MVDRRLIDYIRSEEAQGYTPQQLHNYLVQQGHNPNDVRWAIDFVNRQRYSRIPNRNPAYRTKDMGKKVNKKFTIIIISLVLVISAVLASTWFMIRPVCGNGEVEKGETPETCCLDAGCLGEQNCENNICIEPTCGECQYLKNHICKDYECCDNNACSETQKCQNNKCEELNCDSCQYILNRTCKDYACCIDSDCDDNNPNTMGKCNNPKMLTAYCSDIVIIKCSTDSECNDYNISTKDICSGTPKICSNIKITSCTNNDSYCPSNCDYNNDSDCQKPDECTFNSNCDDNNISTKDICSGTPKICSNIKITDCIINDGYCPPGCNNSNDNDCKEGDFIVSGKIKVTGMDAGELLDYTTCSAEQVLYFKLYNDFKDTVYNINYDLYVDGKKESSGNSLMRAGSPLNYSILSGDNTVYIIFDESVSERNITISVNPNKGYKETNENNNIIGKNFSSDKMDLSIVSIEYSNYLNKIDAVIKRNKIIKECPKFSSEIYVNETLIDDEYVFEGFGDILEGKLSTNYSLISGTYEIKVIVDSGGIVRESNEGNNIKIIDVDI